jgi:hypothetical protein
MLPDEDFCRYGGYHYDSDSLRQRNLRIYQRPWLQNTTRFYTRDQLLSLLPIYQRSNIPIPSPVAPGGGSYVEYISDTPTSGPSYTYQPYASSFSFTIPQLEVLQDIRCTKILSFRVHFLNLSSSYSYSNLKLQLFLGPSSPSHLIFECNPGATTTIGGSMSMDVDFPLDQSLMKFNFVSLSGFYSTYLNTFTPSLHFAQYVYQPPVFTFTFSTSGISIIPTFQFFLEEVAGLHM